MTSMKLTTTRHSTSRRRAIVLAGLAAAVAFTGTVVLGDLSAGPRVDAASQFTALPSPKRVVDTRADGWTADGKFVGIGQQAAGSTLRIPIAGRVGIPSNANAVVVNVTVVSPEQAGFVTMYPCSEPRPTASNVNFGPGEIIANLVVASVESGGDVCLYTKSRSHFVVDATGYFPSGTYKGLTAPKRILDTRPGAKTVDGKYSAVGALAAGSTLRLPVTGRAGVAKGAPTVVLNVTATGATAPGHVTVYPCDAERPTASNLNFVAGDEIANTVVTGLSDDGLACVYSSTRVDLVVDATGVLPWTTFKALSAPRRLLDTRQIGRTFDGAFQQAGRISAGTSTQLHIAGRAGVPTNATAVVLNVTAAESDGPGYLTVFPAGTKRPTASNLNYLAGQAIPNAVIAPIGAGGNVCLFTLSTAHLVVDVAGYLVGNAVSTSGTGCPEAKSSPTPRAPTPPAPAPPAPKPPAPPAPNPPPTPTPPDEILAPKVGTHFGAFVSKRGAGDAYDSVVRLEQSLGRQFAIINRFHTFSSGVDSKFHFDRAYIADGRIVMMSWRATDNPNGTSGTTDSSRAKKIVAGQFDKEIRAMAQGVKGLNAKVLIRFNWEMDQSPGSAQYIGTPAEFIAAWRYVHDFFVREGATNAVWVWAPRAASFNKGEGQKFYPGDAYVDWIGASAVPINSFRDAVTIYGDWYNWASQRGKPMLLWVGLRENPTSAQWKAGFLKELDGLISGPWSQVKATVYYHSNSPKGYDYWADTSTASWNAFKAMGCDPHFATNDTC